MESRKVFTKKNGDKPVSDVHIAKKVVINAAGAAIVQPILSKASIDRQSGGKADISSNSGSKELFFLLVKRMNKCFFTKTNLNIRGHVVQ